jgi:RimJ/RimL family protein N-acetyltransferase
VNSYKAISNQKISNGRYAIVPIRYEDRMDILKWRNEQVYHLRQDKPLTETDQEYYFKTIVSRLFEEKQPSQFLFSYLEGEECIGYGGLVHINWHDKNAEISFIMDTKLEQEYFSNHWTSFLGLIEQVAFKELNLYKIFTFAYDLRPHLYDPIEASGFIKEAVLRKHCFFNGVFKDVIIHSKFNSEEK